MPEQISDGSIVITPKEFYDGVQSDIKDIKNAVSPLPQLRIEVEEHKRDGFHWLVAADPDGNRFCLIEPPPTTD